MPAKVLPKDNSFYDKLDLIRKYCITKSPGFAGIALLPAYYVVDPKDARLGKEYGFTDGRSIYLGTKLFKESPKAQAFVLIHEVLHVALRHPQRMLTLRKARLMQGKTWSSEVFNWAVDAIVNHSLERINAWVHKPSIGLIEFDKLLSPTVLAAQPPHTWGAEQLFTHLMDTIVDPAIARGEAGDAKDWGEKNLPGQGRGMLDIELADDGAGSIREDTKAEARDWSGRVARAAAGDRPGGIMKEILFDVQQTRTPWRTLLRRFVCAAVMPQTQVRPSRPSRQTVMLDALSRSGAGVGDLVPFIPGYQQKYGIRKIVVIVDTSGSIDDTLCEYFAGEIQTIRKKMGCDMVLLTCDTEVHQTISIKAHDNLHAIIKKEGGFKGRGGTDFRPAVAIAEKVPGAAVVIYLTDMMGPYPDKCRLPLLWASICTQYTKPPCGTVIVLRKDET